VTSSRAVVYQNQPDKFSINSASALVESPWAVFGVTIAIGILWEIWEFLLEYAFSFRLSRIFGWRRKYWTVPDTVLDLVLDSAGAIAFLALFYLV
jgi:hypothetical protein